LQRKGVNRRKREKKWKKAVKKKRDDFENRYLKRLKRQMEEQ